MPFTANNPYVKDGVSYNLVGVSLITSPGYGERNVDARVVLQLEPYRINEDGKVERPMMEVETDEGTMLVPDRAGNRNDTFTNAYSSAATDPALLQVLTEISVAIQKYINARGH